MENYIGKYCVVRGPGSGVFAGTLAVCDEQKVVIKDARRIWRWAGATETIGLATSGVSAPAECKFTITASEIILCDVHTILPCTPEAEARIKAVAEWKA